MPWLVIDVRDKFSQKNGKCLRNVELLVSDIGWMVAILIVDNLSNVERIDGELCQPTRVSNLDHSDLVSPDTGPEDAPREPFMVTVHQQSIRTPDTRKENIR